VVLVLLGFAVGAFGSAWQTRDLRAEPWRKMRVEHQGAEGATTRTRVVFESSKLAVQAVELVRNPEGKPESARVTLKSGDELTVGYRGGRRPSSLEAADGSRALFAYKGDRARVAFVSADGKKVGDKTVTVPVELRSTLSQASRRAPTAHRWARLWRGIGAALVGEAWAQDKEDDKVTVRRDVAVRLEIRVAGKGKLEPGSVDVETTCAPFTCLPASPSATMPGLSTVHVGVSASAKKSALARPAEGALGRFKETAAEERRVAARVLPDVTTAIAAVGVAAVACKSLDLTGPLCVKQLGKGPTAGAAIVAIRGHEVDDGRRVVDGRAEELYYEEQARKALDATTDIQVCLSRDGYARKCTTVSGRPFGAQPMAATARSVELRRGIGGTLEGSFEMVQSDGPDCKFSPSPRTSGTLKLTFDAEKHTATGSLKSTARGTRPNMSCSMGTANMSWSNSYSATVTQSFSAAQLQSGGELPLRMTGTMSGSGSYSFSNCRTRSGGSVNCPAGKSDSYTYKIELVGKLDLDTQKGSGRITVQNAPLATVGTWRIPKAGGAK
jgi:hypothetical protein